MRTLNDIEREARRTRESIAELRGFTQKFDQALVRAEDERRLHLAKIADEEAHLSELIDAAAVIVQHLGADVPVETAHTEAETAAVMAEDASQAEQFEIAASAWLETQFEALDAGEPSELFDDEPEADAFQTIGEIAAEVTAAVAAIADPVPATEDATDEPELTNDQAERVEELLAEATPIEATPIEAPPVEVEKPESALAKAGFFLNRAFA